MSGFISSKKIAKYIHDNKASVSEEEIYGYFHTLGDKMYDIGGNDARNTYIVALSKSRATKQARIHNLWKEITSNIDVERMKYEDDPIKN